MKPDSPGNRRVLVLMALALALWAGLLYFRTGGFNFIHLDDTWYTRDNPLVKEGLTSYSVKSAFTGVHEKFWIPLTWLSYMADVELSGMDPGGFHRTNATIFTLSSVLLFCVLCSATGSPVKSFFAAALWTLCPLRVESVAWITERKDVLAGFFFLLSLLTYLRYAKKNRLPWLAVATFFGALGLMSKPVTVVLPVALLLLDFWPLGRFPVGGPLKDPKGYGRLLLEKAPLIVFSAVIVLYTLTMQSSSVARNAKEIGVFALLANAGRSYFIYLGKTLWPVNLIIEGIAPVTGMNLLLGGVSWAVIVLLCVLAYRARRRYPELTFGWFWYLLLLFPNSGIVNAGIQNVSDRFTYLPHVGLFVSLVWFFARMAKERGWGVKPLVALGAAVLLAYGGLSYAQVGRWKDTMTLFGHVNEVTGGTAMAHQFIGSVYFERKNYEEALNHFNETLRLDPGFPNVNVSLAKTYLRLGRRDEIGEALLRATKKSPNSAETEMVRSAFLEARGDLFGAYIAEGSAFFIQGRYAKAADSYKKAMGVNPVDTQASFNLAVVTALMGKKEEAMALYGEVIRREPSNYKAHYNLAVLLEEKGDLSGARTHLREVLRQSPGIEGARKMLSRIGGS